MYLFLLCLLARAQDEEPSFGDSVRFSQSSLLLVQVGWGLTLLALFVVGFGFAQGRDTKTLQFRAPTAIGWGMAMLFVGVAAMYVAPVMNGQAPSIVPELPSWRTMVMSIILGTVGLWTWINFRPKKHKQRLRQDP